MDLKSKIRNIPNFPKEGILFRDITTVLQDPKALNESITEMTKKIKDLDFDLVMGPESRGFIFGVPIAYNTQKGFIPVRKKGKLPYETLEKTYNLEYGTATIEIHKDAIKPGQKVVIVDDLLATGGTCKAVCDLIEQAGGEVVSLLFFIELLDLEARKLLNKYKIESIIQY